MDHKWHLVNVKVMISLGNPSILSDFLSPFQPKCSYAVSMATGMHMDERSVDRLVLGHHDQDRKVSAKSVTMRAMTLCKNLSGYRELLLIINKHQPRYQNILINVHTQENIFLKHCNFYPYQ